MLIPRFSLRGLLGLITCCSVLFTIASFAFRGQRWAIAVIAAIGSVAIVAVIHATFFLAAWLLTQLSRTASHSRQARSLSTDAALSPRVIDAPADPE